MQNYVQLLARMHYVVRYQFQIARGRLIKPFGTFLCTLAFNQVLLMFPSHWLNKDIHTLLFLQLSTHQAVTKQQQLNYMLCDDANTGKVGECESEYGVSASPPLCFFMYL